METKETMNNELLQRSLTSRNERAIKELVDKEALIVWANSPTPPLPIQDKIAYTEQLGRNYLSYKKNKVVQYLL